MSGTTTTTTTLAYVRTPAGVVKVQPGAQFPDDAIDGEADRLTAGGVLETAAPSASTSTSGKRGQQGSGNS